MLPRRTFWTYFALTVLALLSWWGASLISPTKEKTTETGERGKIDYYSKNVTRTSMDEYGKPKQVLFAVTLVHYEGDDHTELTKPVLTLYGKKDGPPWVIHSDSALLPANSDTLYLNGNVLITRDSDKTGRTLRIITRNARVQPDKDYAETSEFIQVLSPPDELSGKGAEVHFGEDIKITVLSQVRRKHDTQPK